VRLVERSVGAVERRARARERRVEPAQAVGRVACGVEHLDGQIAQDVASIRSSGGGGQDGRVSSGGGGGGGV